MGNETFYWDGLGCVSWLCDLRASVLLVGDGIRWGGGERQFLIREKLRCSV